MQDVAPEKGVGLRRELPAISAHPTAFLERRRTGAPNASGPIYETPGSGKEGEL